MPADHANRYSADHHDARNARHEHIDCAANGCEGFSMSWADKARERFGEAAVMTGRGVRIALTRKKD